MENGAGRKLLYVEDNLDLRESLSAALSREGYDVQVAGDAGEGLACLGERRFHLVISDYGLPDQTGAWMLREAAARGLLDRTGALIVTAHTEPVEAGGIPVLQKPLDLVHLLAWIAEVCA